MNLTKETFIYEHFDHLNIKEFKCLLSTLTPKMTRKQN